MSTTRPNHRNEVLCTVYKTTFHSQRKLNIKPEEKTSKIATNRLTKKHNENGRNLKILEIKRDSSGSKFKAKVSKCVTDSGVNTLISGPKLCDSKSATNIKTRGKQRSCRCGRRVMFKMVDKYTQYVDIWNCSTQCPNYCSIKTNTNALYHHNNTHKKPQSITIKYTDVKQPGASFVIYENRTPRDAYKSNYPIHLGVNRWAISRHPVRGPDF